MLLQRLPLIAMGLCFVATPLRAQSTGETAGTEQPQSVSRPNILVYHHASTAAEGWLRGYADLLRGFGDSMLSQAEAACFAETARERWLQNRQRSVEQYWVLRLLHRAYSQALTRKTARSRSTPQSIFAPKPKRCSPEQLGPSGKIGWPLSLRCKTCSAAVGRLEAIFARRAAGETTLVGTAAYRDARAAIAEIVVDLQSRVRKVPGREYVAAKQLLTALDNEIGLAPPPALYSQN
jgi:hypothetical protein